MKAPLAETRGHPDKSGVSPSADERYKQHQLSFGTISHTLPGALFKKPRNMGRVINPGITEEYRFEESENASAVLIITKVRKDYPKDDSLLDNVISGNKALQRQFGEDIVWLRTASKDNPRIEELIFLNAMYDQMSFPYGMGGENLSREVECLGISSIFVQNEMLIECAMHLKRAKVETKDAFIKRAQDLCLQWQKTIKTEKAK